LWYYTRTSLNEPKKKTMKNFSQDNQSLGWDFNSGPPEYKALVSTTHPSCSLSTYCQWMHCNNHNLQKKDTSPSCISRLGVWSIQI